MKKTIALFSSLLVFAGLKAQPPVKKETAKPVIVKPSPVDSLKAVKGNAALKLTDKAIKIGQVKNTNTLPFKENALPMKQLNATPKPDKH